MLILVLHFTLHICTHTVMPFRYGGNLDAKSRSLLAIFNHDLKFPALAAGSSSITHSHTSQHTLVRLVLALLQKDSKKWVTKTNLDLGQFFAAVYQVMSALPVIVLVVMPMLIWASCGGVIRTRFMKWFLIRSQLRLKVKSKARTVNSKRLRELSKLIQQLNRWLVKNITLLWKSKLSQLTVSNMGGSRVQWQHVSLPSGVKILVRSHKQLLYCDRNENS